jgi:hypothetical protein
MLFEDNNGHKEGEGQRGIRVTGRSMEHRHEPKLPRLATTNDFSHSLNWTQAENAGYVVKLHPNRSASCRRMTMGHGYLTYLGKRQARNVAAAEGSNIITSAQRSKRKIAQFSMDIKKDSEDPYAIQLTPRDRIP